MPILNKFDSYNECLGLFGDGATFCFVRTFIKPNISSELYNYISEFSSYRKQHFRHDILNRGVCIDSCMKVISEIGESAEKYFVPEFEMDTDVSLKQLNVQWLITFTSILLKMLENLSRNFEAYKNMQIVFQLTHDFVEFRNANEYRKSYNKLVNQYVNVELTNSYNLQGFSSIMFCTQKSNPLEKGSAFWHRV